MTNSLWGNIFKTGKKEEDEICDILKKIPVFEDLSRKELLHLERILHQREYSSEEVIFRQGDPGLGMYIIEDGTAAIVTEPAQKVLAELRGGEFFGELALLDDSPRTATAVAKAPSRLLCFFQPDLLDLIQRNPRMGVKILFRLARTIGERLKRSNEHMHALHDSRITTDEKA
ncbi:MAG: cyclic nucleotide-binding domain-containing protein [Nitrospirae bacterium]|nr:cyclic nucleotide-binding domain-containing protein [Nitrospirota bacterium]